MLLTGGTAAAAVPAADPDLHRPCASSGAAPRRVLHPTSLRSPCADLRPPTEPPTGPRGDPASPTPAPCSTPAPRLFDEGAKAHPDVFHAVLSCERHATRPARSNPGNQPAAVPDWITALTVHSGRHRQRRWDEVTHVRGVWRRPLAPREDVPARRDEGRRPVFACGYRQLPFALQSVERPQQRESRVGSPLGEQSVHSRPHVTAEVRRRPEKTSPRTAAPTPHSYRTGKCLMPLSQADRNRCGSPSLWMFGRWSAIALKMRSISSRARFAPTQ